MSNIQIKTEFGGFPQVSVIDCDDGLIVSSDSYPIRNAFSISYEEAADLAQKLMDVVSDHIQKAAS